MEFQIIKQSDELQLWELRRTDPGDVVLTQMVLTLDGRPLWPMPDVPGTYQVTCDGRLIAEVTVTADGTWTARGPAHHVLRLPLVPLWQLDLADRVNPAPETTPPDSPG